MTNTEYRRQLKKAKTEFAQRSQELTKWESLMLDSIEGTYVFTPEQIKRRMESVQDSRDRLSV